MAFNVRAKEKLGPLMAKYGYQIIEDNRYGIEFGSGNRGFRLVHNPLEYSYEIEVVSSEWVGLDLTNRSVIEFFDSDIDIDVKTEAEFLDAVVSFLRGPAQALLASDEEEWKRFQSYKKAITKQYNENYHLCIKLELAARLWRKQEYAEFVKLLEEVGSENISPAFRKRLEIAKSHLS